MADFLHPAREGGGKYRANAETGITNDSGKLVHRTIRKSKGEKTKSDHLDIPRAVSRGS